MLEDLQLRFTDNEISPWGGLTLLFRMLEKCNMGYRNLYIHLGNYIDLVNYYHRIY